MIPIENIKKVDDVYFHRKYKTTAFGVSCKLFYECKNCQELKWYYLFTNGSESKLKKLRRGIRICLNCTQLLHEEKCRLENLEKEQITINITLKELCDLPDVSNYPVVAISSSKDDKIKVSVGRISKEEYFESRIKVCDTYEFAVNYAIDFAKTIGTDHVYEIRVFKDHSSECIRIFKKIHMEVV